MEKSSADLHFTHFEDDDLEEFKAWGKSSILQYHILSMLGSLTRCLELDWTEKSMEKGKQELTDPILWDREWDTRMGEATLEDINYVKAFQAPKNSSMIEGAATNQGSSTTVTQTS